LNSILKRNKSLASQLLAIHSSGIKKIYKKQKGNFSKAKYQLTK
jgi:hypothetical protein